MKARHMDVHSKCNAKLCIENTTDFNDVEHYCKAISPVKGSDMVVAKANRFFERMDAALAYDDDDDDDDDIDEDEEEKDEE
ncbi:hypothetical protein V1478_013310, partial [Vespula squamosa]